MTATNESFFADIDGALTPEQASQAFALAEQGDTVKTETGDAPASTTATDDQSAATTQEQDEQKQAASPNEDDASGKDKAGTTDETGIDPAKAVVLAKDGVHTIPYDRLEKARQGEQHWRAQAEAAQQQLAELQARAQARADAGQAPTKTDNMVAKAEAAIEAGADAGLFGDFSEEALASGIAKLVTQQVAAQVNKAMEPLQAKQQQSEAQAHYDAIYKAHPNADSIAQSAEFKAWVDAQPSVVRNAYWQLFDPQEGGSADQIVEVFDAFVKSSGKPAPTAVAPDRAKAEAAAASARAEPPVSLSGIPGGRADGLSPQERMASLGGQELYSAMENMSPAQIEAYLNKQM